MDELNQGSVLYGLRSDRYPGIPCYGIVITASCDIANSKVSKIYCLIGVDAKQWFCTEYGYRQAYSQKITSSFKDFKHICDRFSLDATSLSSFTTEEVHLVVQANISQKTDQQKILEEYQKFSKYSPPHMNDEKRKQCIQCDPKPVISFLKDIEKERIFHYFYLPKSTYLKESSEMDSGLIIDLQEISFLSMDDAKQIVRQGIDNLLLCQQSLQTCDRLRTNFWLENPDDFVAVEGNIISPWREHLMQRFSRDFSRIGLDGATEQDYKKLAESI